MSIRNAKQEELRRLESKTLDAQFKTAVQEGLNCSPFESEAVLGVVREVYFPFMGPSTGTAPPGKVTLVAVCADEPAGKPVSDCEMRATVGLDVASKAQLQDRAASEDPAARGRPIKSVRTIPEQGSAHGPTRRQAAPMVKRSAAGFDTMAKRFGGRPRRQKWPKGERPSYLFDGSLAV